MLIRKNIMYVPASADRKHKTRQNRPERIHIHNTTAPFSHTPRCNFLLRKQQIKLRDISQHTRFPALRKSTPITNETLTAHTQESTTPQTTNPLRQPSKRIRRQLR